MAELLNVVEMPNKGRGLVCTRPLVAGEIVLRESPLLLYSAVPLGGATAANYCSHCFRIVPPNSPTVVPCPHCSSASLFCTAECRSIALSSSHSPFVCHSLARLRGADSPLRHQHPDRHVQSWFLVSAYNLALMSPVHFQALISLQGESIVDETSVFLHSLISSVCPFPSNGNHSGFSVELTAALLSKDKLNAFGLMEPFDQQKERSVRAYGIYPKASFFNHDCLPNACRFDYIDSIADPSNIDIVVRVLHDLAAGREVCLSYFPVNLKFSDRQQRLKDDYDFTCDCDRCRVEVNWSDNEEDDDQEMEADENGDDMEDDLETGSEEGNSDDFPHAYFFIRYMCNRDSCGGTLCPLPPSNASSPVSVMECNVCGKLESRDEDSSN